MFTPGNEARGILGRELDVDGSLTGEDAPQHSGTFGRALAQALDHAFGFVHRRLQRSLFILLEGLQPGPSSPRLF